MSPKAKTYQYLIDEFTEEKRFQYLKFECNDILKRFNSSSLNLHDSFRVNDSIIQDIVINYFADIDRLKKFHGIDKVNSIKIASYSGYWLAKLKPVQVYNTPTKQTIIDYRKLFSQINEKIALALIMGISFDQSIQKSCTKELVEFLKFLVYTLVYRVNTPQMIELSLQAHIANPSSPLANMED